MLRMIAATKSLIERLASWPKEDVKKLDVVAREIEARRTGVYHATVEELKMIDEALAEVAQGKIATEKEVGAAFAKFRNA